LPRPPRHQRFTSTADRKRITGVRLANRDTGADEELSADLVVDAMGRGAHTPARCRGVWPDWI
jgi:glycerol-3-phosphate dehydrogenase